MTGARWAREVGGFVRSGQEHAEAFTGALKEAVRGNRTDASRERAVVALALEALGAAYAAGVREGRSSYQAEAGHLIRDQIMRAFSSVALEHAPCPHCLGRGCLDCNQIGKRAKPAHP